MKIDDPLGASRPTVYTWIHRFNEQGLHGLDDRPRAGRPPTYTAEQRAEVIAVALTDPRGLGLPFGCGTLDRLEVYLNEPKGIPIKRSRIDEILLAEGLRWRHQETWSGARVDPAFAEKRGSSRRSTPRPRRARSSSASTRWAPNRPRASRGSNSSTPHPNRMPAAPTHSPRSPTPDRDQTRGDRPGPPNGPGRGSTMDDVAGAPSSAPSARPPARR